MYAPHQVPKGPHHVYIFHDPTKSRFKIGESRNPHARRSQVARDVLNWSERPKLEEYHRWTFQNYYAGICVEQSMIDLLKTHGFAPVRGPDWFEIDKLTMDATIVSIDELARSIIAWEEMNATAECNACRKEKPYGAYLYDTHFVTMDHWYELESGRLEPSGETVEERIERVQEHYKVRKRKMPEKLLELIATVAGSQKQSTE